MATSAATRIAQDTLHRPTLFLAFELSTRPWTRGFTTGRAQRPRVRSVPARAIPAVLAEIAPATPRFGLPEEARGLSCYEAGRDGCWLHRGFVAQRVENVVGDSSRIEVQRRKRRAKTDRLDVHKLLMLLLRHQAGEQQVWSVVQVPTRAAEDRRQLPRELLTAKPDRTRVSKRIKGLLASPGLAVPLPGDGKPRLEQQRLWEGSPLPVGLRQRLIRAWEQLAGLSQRLAPREAERRELIRTAEEAAMQKVRQLVTLKGMGTNSAWVFVMACFGGRTLRQGQAVGALSGLTPPPYASGTMAYELGIAKAGHRHRRALASEMAWGWRRLQPESARTQWDQRRLGQGSSRRRRMGIVALARQWLMALWRCGETGGLPEGAGLKAVVRL
jgi:transposase